MTNWQTILSFSVAVIFVVINGITQLIYAQSLGYKLKPTSFAYFIGAVGNMISGNVTPISAQAETLTISGLIKNINTRIGSLLFASLIGILLGIFGLISSFVDYAGKSIIFGMMAGVGLILSETALSMMKNRRRVGIISIISAFITWIIFKDLVLTIAISVLLSTLDFSFIQHQRIEVSLNSNEFQHLIIIRPRFNLTALMGGLSIICLNIGSNISFGTITSDIAGRTPNFDYISIINSLADIPSVIFGGMPLETIISGTAATNWPVLGGILMMLISGVLIFTGAIQKMGRLIPAESISGFLLVIGFSLTLLPNLIYVSETDQIIDGLTSASVTVLTKNAFLGIIAGICIRMLRTLGGITI